MDARIGQLMRDGEIVHYAFLSGTAPAVEGSLEAVETALGLRQPFAPAPVAKVASITAPQRAMRTYLVTVTPSAVVHVGGWQSGPYTVEIIARERGEALKEARREWVEDVAIGVKATFHARLKID